MSIAQRLRGFVRVNRGLFLSLIALGVAVYFSAGYVRQFMAASSDTSESHVPTVSVVVVRTAIPAMSPISPADLTVESWPASNAPPGAYSNIAALNGAWSDEALAVGVPITASATFIPKTANILAARIAPGDMATDLPLSPTEAIDGLINPGDTISLFTTITESNGQSVIEDFLNDVKVLEVNGSLTPPSTPTVGQSETLILALPPSQIAALLFIQQKGTITAVLDSPDSTAPAPAPYGSAQWQKPVM